MLIGWWAVVEPNQPISQAQSIGRINDLSQSISLERPNTFSSGLSRIFETKGWVGVLSGGGGHSTLTDGLRGIPPRISYQ